MKIGAEVSLKWYAKELIKKVEKAQAERMKAATFEVRNTVLETLSGNRTGRTYNVPGTRRKYTASAPGEPPAVATAELRKGIKAKVAKEGGRIIGYVGTKVKHGLMLEFGTRNMAARPWLRVSLQKTMPKLKGIFGEGKWL